MSLSNNIKNSLDKFDIVKNSKKFLIGSLTLILIGMIVIFMYGFNLGIDFTGGTVLSINIGSDLETGTTYDDYTATIETILTTNSVELSLKQLEGEGDDASILIRYQDIDGYTESEMADVSTQIITDIELALGLEDGDVQNAQRIGPSATASLLQNALLAILFATILILIYIAFRFELVSGLAAIIALLHDVLIMCSLTAIFQIQINSAFIAALITIIGYSINDTIVVFDRVRENRGKDSLKNKSNADIVNLSIKETIIRTLNTSITTLFTITMLAVLSVATIREFAIPIIFGLIAGTYSSMFIATPFWAFINDKTRPKNKHKRALNTLKKDRQKESKIQV
jgi:preprotein translocase SecF subunit